VGGFCTTQQVFSSSFDKKKERVGFGICLYDKEKEHFPKRRCGEFSKQMNEKVKSGTSASRRHWWSV